MAFLHKMRVPLRCDRALQTCLRAMGRGTSDIRQATGSLDGLLPRLRAFRVSLVVALPLAPTDWQAL
jgi:hypothetical protein